jgi:hypothetical protein
MGIWFFLISETTFSRAFSSIKENERFFVFSVLTGGGFTSFFSLDTVGCSGFSSFSSLTLPYLIRL